MLKTKILRASECEVNEAAWGALTWYASGKLGNSRDITVGRCLIKPGCENPLHSHPNCSEVLIVLQGRIMHTIEGGREEALTEGDVIAIPAALPHRARNICEGDAVLLVAFSSADRQTRGE